LPGGGLVGADRHDDALDPRLLEPPRAQLQDGPRGGEKGAQGAAGRVLWCNVCA